MTRAPWAAHFGLARTPFGKRIAAKDLFARQAHAEAVARISFCVAESALGVVTGDVGAGKTVALRAAVAGLDPTRHQVIYIPNPAFGTRGLYVTIVRALGAQPRYLKAELMAQASDLLAAETAERHRQVVLIVVGWPGASQPRAPTESVRNSLLLYGSCRPGHLAAGFTQAQCAKYLGRRAAASLIACIDFFQVLSFLYLFMVHRSR